MRLRLPTINHRLPTCQSTARVCGLLDRVGDALAEERERLELKAIEMLKEPKRLVQPEPVIMLGGMMVPAYTALADRSGKLVCIQRKGTCHGNAAQ